MKTKSVEILGVRVDCVSSNDVLSLIKDAVQKEEKKVFAYLTVHAINLAQVYPWFKEFLNTADIAYPDSEGVRLGSWILGQKLPPQTALTRWIWSLAEFCTDKNLSMYLLGSKLGVVEKAATALKNRFPLLKLVGCHHGFFQKHGMESDTVIEKINSAKPNVLLVGFGMPTQEDWIRRNKDRLHVNAILTAGSCFDYAAGIKSSCPTWVSRSGFEWLYRFLFEPRRLFKRYFFGNPQYLARVLLQRMRNGKIQQE